MLDWGFLASVRRGSLSFPHLVSPLAPSFYGWVILPLQFFIPAVCSPFKMYDISIFQHTLCGEGAFLSAGLHTHYHALLHIQDGKSSEVWNLNTQEGWPTPCEACPCWPHGAFFENDEYFLSQLHHYDCTAYLLVNQPSDCSSAGFNFHSHIASHISNTSALFSAVFPLRQATKLHSLAYPLMMESVVKMT